MSFCGCDRDRTDDLYRVKVNQTFFGRVSLNFSEFVTETRGRRDKLIRRILFRR
jgi:hypothetical protein